MMKKIVTEVFRTHSFFVRKCRSFAAIFVGFCCVAILSGCSFRNPDFNRPPELSPVRADLGYSRVYNREAVFPGQEERKYSLYHPGASGFYRDPRAMKPGDVLTVLISINDRANLNNKSDMKRNSDAEYGINTDISWLSRISGSAGAGSKSSAKGDAKVERREDIRLSVAAVVTSVLPNGNLVINGSQEVRVNYELRVLNIAGVVRPRDIAGNNTIDYNKIAEARISYGGRGGMSEVQHPPYGQRYLNRIFPF